MFLPLAKKSRRANARRGARYKAKLNAKNRRRRNSLKR